MPFVDRRDAGRRLAARLSEHRSSDPIVVGLPRGGVIVADEVAQHLGAPLDVIVVRKLGAPAQPELAIGAVAEDDILVLNHNLVARMRISDDQLDDMVARETSEIDARVVRFRHGHDPIAVKDRTVLLIDDGLATGATARAAARVLRGRDARRIVLGVPICSPDSADALRLDVDEVVSVETSNSMISVGSWYQDFSSVADADVVDILSRYRSD